MKQDGYYEIMHLYFNTVLQLRQDLRSRVQTVLDESGHKDVTLEMMQVLYYISFVASSQRSNQNGIAEYIGKNKSSITSILNNLEKRKLVRRMVDKTNKRSNIISMTTEGSTILKKLYREVYSTYDLQKISLKIEDIQQITQLLDRIIKS